MPASVTVATVEPCRSTARTSATEPPSLCVHSTPGCVRRDGQPAGLDQGRVRQRHHDLGRRGRGREQQPGNRRDRASDERQGRRTSRVCRCGVTPQSATSASYSASAPGSGCVVAVRTARIIVLRGVYSADDELHDLDPVADPAQQRGPDRVGEHVAEPLAQDRVPGHQPVRRGRAAGRHLPLQVVVAAGRCEHDRGLPADRLGERVVGGGVAGVQREHDVDRGVLAVAGRRVDDVAGHEASSRSDQPSSAASALLRSRISGRWSMPVSRTVPVGSEEPVGREAQVGVAAAEVDDPQRPPGRQVGLGHRGLQHPQERVDLAPLARARAEHPEQRVARIDEVRRRPVVLGVLLAGLGLPVQLRRDPSWSPAAAASRWSSARASCRTAGRAARRPRRRPASPYAGLRGASAWRSS